MHHTLHQRVITVIVTITHPHPARARGVPAPARADIHGPVRERDVEKFCLHAVPKQNIPGHARAARARPRVPIARVVPLAVYAPARRCRRRHGVRRHHAASNTPRECSTQISTRTAAPCAVRVDRNAARRARDDDHARVLRARARRRAMSIADASRSASLCAALGHGFGSPSASVASLSRARAHRTAGANARVRAHIARNIVLSSRDSHMADARATPAQDSQAKKGELSYHYWHGRNAGEAPAATAKVRARARLCILLTDGSFACDRKLPRRRRTRSRLGWRRRRCRRGTRRGRGKSAGTRTGRARGSKRCCVSNTMDLSSRMPRRRDSWVVETMRVETFARA